MTQYVRIKPYSKNAGTLARRVVVGGKLFVAGKWYTLTEASAAQLSKLKQGTGASYFDVVSEEAYREVARRELAAAMAAAGLTGLAMQGVEPTAPPVSPEPKTGPRKSEFEGLEGQVRDVDPAKPEAPAAPEPAPETETKPVDLENMTKAELKDLAGQLEVEVPSGASASRLRALLRPHV